MRWSFLCFMLLFLLGCLEEPSTGSSGILSPPDSPLSDDFYTQSAFPSMIFLTETHGLGNNVQENTLLWAGSDAEGLQQKELQLYSGIYLIEEMRATDERVEFNYELQFPALAPAGSSVRWPVPKIAIHYFGEENALEIVLSNNYYGQAFEDIRLIAQSGQSYSIQEISDESAFGGSLDSVRFTAYFERILPLHDIDAFRIHWKNGDVSPDYPLRNYFRDANLADLQQYAFDRLSFFQSNSSTSIHSVGASGFVAGINGSEDHFVRFDRSNPLQPSQVVPFPHAIAEIANPDVHYINRIERNGVIPMLRTVDLRDLSSVTRPISAGLDLNQELYGPVNGDYFGVSADTAHTYLRIYNQNLSLLKEHKPLEISTVNVVFTSEAHAFINHPDRGANDGRLIHINLQGHSLEVVHDVPHALGRLWGASENYLIYTSPGYAAEFTLVVMNRIDKSIIWSIPLDMPVSQATLVDESADLLVINGAGFYRALRLSDGQVLISDFGKNFGNSFSPPRLKLGADQKTIFFQNAYGVGGKVRLP